MTLSRKITQNGDFAVYDNDSGRVRRVGTIKRDWRTGKGWYYQPAGSKLRGDDFASVAECFRSLLPPI